MHTKVVFQGAKGLARLGCAVLRFNFRGVGRSEGAFDQGDRREGRLLGGARLHVGALSGHSALGGRVLLRLLGGARSRRARRSCLRADRRRAAGRHFDLRHDIRVPGHAGEREAQVPGPGRSRRGVPDRGHVEVLRAAATNRRSWSSSTPPIICSKARRRKSARRSRTCWRGSDMKEAVIVSAVRTPVGKAPNGVFRQVRPDEMAAVGDRGGAPSRAGARSRGHRRRRSWAARCRRRSRG